MGLAIYSYLSIINILACATHFYVHGAVVVYHEPSTICAYNIHCESVLCFTVSVAGLYGEKLNS